jgi:hypothetical protein
LPLSQIVCVDAIVTFGEAVDVGVGVVMNRYEDRDVEHVAVGVL